MYLVLAGVAVLEIQACGKKNRIDFMLYDTKNFREW